MPNQEEISPAPETVESTIAHADPAEHHGQEHEAETGGFREPHPEVPAEFASHETESPAAQAEDAEEAPSAPRPEPLRVEQRDRRSEQRRPEPQRELPRPKPWAKPADFRPAEASAISQAVEHATEIAGSLKQMIDQLDEVLELVEVAERQKLADEREIEELRRALRRIQPPRREQQPPPPRGPRRDEPRRDEPRRDAREQNQRSEEPPVSREPALPRENPSPAE